MILTEEQYFLGATTNVVETIEYGQLDPRLLDVGHKTEMQCPKNTVRTNGLMSEVCTEAVLSPFVLYQIWTFKFSPTEIVVEQFFIEVMYTFSIR